MLNSLENPVETRYIRFRPKEWHNGIAMRVEVFGSSLHSGKKASIIRANHKVAMDVRIACLRPSV